MPCALASEQSLIWAQVSIVTADAPPGIEAIAAPLREAGIVVHSIGPVRQFLTIGRDARDALRDVLASGVDVVHIHGMWQHLLHTPPPSRPTGRACRTSFAAPACSIRGRWITDGSRRDFTLPCERRPASSPRARHRIRRGPALPVLASTLLWRLSPWHRVCRPTTLRRDPEADARWPAIKGFPPHALPWTDRPGQGHDRPRRSVGPARPAVPRLASGHSRARLAGHKSELEESLRRPRPRQDRLRRHRPRQRPAHPSQFL